MADVGTAGGFGDRQRADQFAAQGGLDELLYQPVIAGRDHVGHRDSHGEQGGEHPAGGTGLMQFLTDDRGVRRVATVAADRLVKAHAEQTGLRGAQAQVPG